MTGEGLYLGDIQLASMSRHRKVGEPVFVDPADLVTHMFVCGASGFGKTVLGKGVVEEAALAGIPSIVIDLKGDLTSLAIPCHALLREGAHTNSAKTILGEEWADQIQGFTETRQGDKRFSDRAERFATSTDVTVFTPKSHVVRPLQLSSFPRPGKSRADCKPEEREDYLELMQAFGRAFLNRIRGGASKGAKAQQELGLIQALLEHAWDENINLEGTQGVEKLVSWIFHPPIQRIGAMPADAYMDDKHRLKLAREVNSQLTGLEPQWYDGEAFDLNRLLAMRDGRTPIVILNLSHLHDFVDQAFVVAQVCHMIYRWMRQLEGASRPRLLFFIDEVGGAGGSEGFYPSHPYNPPSKAALNILLRQGRAFGVCALLATQNVIGIDHRGLGNVGTWAVGNLNSARERDRIEDTLGASGTPARNFAARMATLQHHEFLLRKRDGSVHHMKERWLYSPHHLINPHSLPHIGTFLKAWHHERQQQGTGLGAAPAAANPPVATPKSAENREAPIAAPVSEPDFDHNYDETLTNSEVDATITQTAANVEAANWRLRFSDGRTKQLDGPGSFTLGRHEACDIVVPDRAVSRRHLTIDVMPRGATVTADTATKNPTLINGKQLIAGQSIAVGEDGAEIRIGETVIQLERLG